MTANGTKLPFPHRHFNGHFRLEQALDLSTAAIVD
jgi:hypothetical protein